MRERRSVFNPYLPLFRSSPAFASIIFTGSLLLLGQRGQNIFAQFIYKNSITLRVTGEERTIDVVVMP